MLNDEEILAIWHRTHKVTCWNDHDGIPHHSRTPDPVAFAVAIEQISRDAAIDEAAKVCDALCNGSRVGRYKGAYRYAEYQIRALNAKEE